eukprot:Pgem_evm2s7700
MMQLWEPACYKDIKSLPDRKEWEESAREELQSLFDNGTYEIIDISELPTGAIIHGNKLIFSVKTDQDGNYTQGKTVKKSGETDL